MHLSLVGISHFTAPVEVRERFAFRPEELPSALRRLGRDFCGAVLLSTCNRTEVVVAGPAPLTDPWPVLQVLCELKDACGRHVGLFYLRTDEEAARHLLRVAAGLESMVLGEAEVLGQVRAALAAAGSAGSDHSLLSRLFSSAIRTGRRARAETGIGRHSVSVSSTAAALAQRILGDLAERCVLVVGAGEAGKLTARSLVERGASRLLVTSRTQERASQVASDLKGKALPFQALRTAMAEADIIITSSSAPTFLIGPELAAAATVHRTARPLLFIDIAVPRDVDPAVQQLPEVRLYDIDDLQALSLQGLRARENEVAAVEALVEEEVQRFIAWRRSMSAMPTVTAIHSRAEAIRQYELERTLPHLGRLTDKERQRLEAMTRAIVKRLLHAPVARLKADDIGATRAAVLQKLFGLEPAVKV